MNDGPPATLPPPAAPPAARASFWQRRVVDPIVAQLTQGITPGRVAFTVAMGVAGGLFPFLGFTTLLCFLIAVIFRLNQPIIHVVNQVLWPVHLTMIVVYVRMGEWLFHSEPMPYDPAEVTHLFLHAQREFWSRFGLMGLHALAAWIVTVPVIVAGIYFPLRPALRHLAQDRLGRRPSS